jgi:hypothetical protein
VQRQHSQRTMESLQKELHALLDERGPCTKLQMLWHLNWFKRKLEHVLGSQPEWLVAVGTTRSQSKFGKLVLYHCRGEHTLGWCKVCQRKVFTPHLKNVATCRVCLELGKNKSIQASRIVPGVDVSKPTEAKAGSEEKIQILGARFDQGVELWVQGDQWIKKNVHEYYQPGEKWNED